MRLSRSRQPCLFEERSIRREVNAELRDRLRSLLQELLVEAADVATAKTAANPTVKEAGDDEDHR
jgi:hypothetical protein